MIAALDDRSALERALTAARAIVYKHSPACWESAFAVRQMRQFAEEHTEVPVYQLDVIADAELARDVAARLGVPHQSPQVILLRGGRATWDAAHLGVRAKALRRALESGGDV